MNIIGKRKILYIFSSVITILGILATIIWGLHFSIDFTGGSMIEVKFPKTPDATKVKIEEAVKDLNLKSVTIQATDSQSYLIRTDTLDTAKHEEFKAKLKEKIGETEEVKFETVGPTVGSDLTRKGILAVVLASIAIILYVAYAFSSVPSPANSWRFGVSAVVALVHDVLVVVGIFAILGHFARIEVDAMFIPAILTVMGFSVHDTIVVFDRIRENLKKHFTTFAAVTNESVIQTLARSINTSATALLTLLAIYFLGGESTKTFALALIIGVVIGTYSSIFIASALMVSWQNWAEKKKQA